MGIRKMFNQTVAILMALIMVVPAYSTPVMAAEEIDYSQRCGLEKNVLIGEIEPDELQLMSVTDSVYLSQEQIDYWSKFSSTYYYNLLNQSGKNLWDALDAACIEAATTDYEFTVYDEMNFIKCSFEDVSEISRDEMTQLAWMYMYNHPQYFFMDGWIMYIDYTSSYEVYLSVYDEFVDYDTRMTAIEAFTTKIEGWIEEIEAYTYPEEKVKAAHDIIALNTLYVSDSTLNQSAYSMVCLGETVCAGYAATLQLLLNPVGIETVEVISDTHAWNNVLLHDNWYGIDVTWGDSDTYNTTYYQFYLRSSDSFGELDEENHHAPTTFYEGYAPETKYDAVVSNYYYVDPYFTVDNYKYFKVNDNTSRAERLAVVVDTFESAVADAAPGTVSNGTNTYSVINGNDGNEYVSLEGIYLDNTSLTITEGDTATLSVSYNPSNTTDDKTVTWSSGDSSIATVSSDGVVTAVAAGSTTITATVGNYTATCSVTVNAKQYPLYGIYLDNTSLTITEGKTATLSVSYNPSNTTDDKTVTWSSGDTSIATVSSDGVVTAVAAGSTTITATVGNYTATCSVTVNRDLFKLVSVEINPSALLLTKGNSQTLSIKYTPSVATINDTPVWSSSDESVAIVDQNGKVTAVNDGTAYIYVYVGDLRGTCELTVSSDTGTSVPLEDITFETNMVDLNVGEKVTFKVVFYPANTTASRTTIWSISDTSVATIDDNGTVTAIAPGTAIVKAQVGGQVTTGFVVVLANSVKPLTGISLNQTELSIGKGESETLTVSYEPSDTTDSKDVTWTSSDSSVATVDADGKITGVEVGTTTITATVGSYTASCVVTVYGEYIGNINSELLKFTYDEATKYISGEIVVVEWVNGVSTVPSVKPVMTFDSTDGTESIEVFVTATGTNTYYFDRLLAGGLTEGKDYVFTVTSGNELNVSQYRSVPIYTGTSSIGSEGKLGTVGLQRIMYKTDASTGYLLVYGEPDTYEGQVNSVVTGVTCVKSADGSNFVSGNIVIVEWIDGASNVPTTTPEMTFESVDGTEVLPIYMASIDGTNTYYFDRNLNEDMDITKEYIFRITLTDPRNVSPLKTMVATTNYLDEKEGMLWETDTQYVMYKSVWADNDNQLRIYAINK